MVRFFFLKNVFSLDLIIDVLYVLYVYNNIFVLFLLALKNWVQLNRDE